MGLLAFMLFTIQLECFQRNHHVSKLLQSQPAVSNNRLFLSDNKDPKKLPELTGIERLKKALADADEPNNKRGPPIYQPGPYQLQILSALAYVIPIADASDLGKYMFEAYPEISTYYNSIFGPVAAIYNGVPFLPFAVFFFMSYICRAPTFPVEVRFHFAQAFMLSLIQFVPSLAFGLLEKVGVPGLAIGYNTGKPTCFISNMHAYPSIDFVQ